MVAEPSDDQDTPVDPRVQALLEATGSIVWSTDSYLRFVEPQPSWAAYTGQTDRDAEGHGWRASVHPDDHDRLEDTWRAAAASGQRYECEVRIWHAATVTWRRARVRAAPVSAAGGAGQGGAETIEAWIGTMEDVEDERRAVERQLAMAAELERVRLEAADERFVLALDGMMEPAALATAMRNADGAVIDFRIDHLNTAAASRAGRSAEELIGLRVLQVWPTMPPDVFEAAAKVVDTGGSITSVALPFVEGVADASNRRWYDLQATRLDGDTILVAWRDNPDQLLDQF